MNPYEGNANIPITQIFTSNRLVLLGNIVSRLGTNPLPYVYTSHSSSSFHFQRFLTKTPSYTIIFFYCYRNSIPWNAEPYPDSVALF